MAKARAAGAGAQDYPPLPALLTRLRADQAGVACRPVFALVSALNAQGEAGMSLCATAGGNRDLHGGSPTPAGRAAVASVGWAFAAGARWLGRRCDVGAVTVVPHAARPSREGGGACLGARHRASSRGRSCAGEISGAGGGKHVPGSHRGVRLEDTRPLCPTGHPGLGPARGSGRPCRRGRSIRWAPSAGTAGGRPRRSRTPQPA